MKIKYLHLTLGLHYFCKSNLSIGIIFKTNLMDSKYRKIIHIDMDAFFASVEQRDNPELRGKPLAVGFDGPRGVVSTASYEARRFGVHSAMPMAKAKQICRDLIVVPCRFDVYKDVSRHVHSIFQRYTDMIEPISIDEAFLDVTENKKGIELAVDIAKEIKAAIREELNLTASAGISYNKFLAKIASDYRKPDGIFVIHPERALDFISNLPVEDFWGVGPKTLQTMHKIGIFNGRQLRECSLTHLTEVFGKAGPVFFNFARGIDNRPVVNERTRKSVGCEHTFLEDLTLKSAVVIELYHTVLELERRIEKSQFRGRTLTLKVKFSDFTNITRSVSVGKPLCRKKDILPLAKELMTQIDLTGKTIRLIGLSVSNPGNANVTPKWVEGELQFEEWK